MKTLFTDFLWIAIPVFSFHAYCGWSGNGTFFIKGGLVCFVLVPLATLIIIVRWCCKSGLGRRSFLVIPVFCALVYMFAMCSPSWGIAAGRHCYWKTHRKSFEHIASTLLSETTPTQIASEASARLGFPVITYSDSSNAVQFVVFSHWRTTAYRDAGFIYCPHPDADKESAIKKCAESVKQMSPNWYWYSVFTGHDFPQSERLTSPEG